MKNLFFTLAFLICSYTSSSAQTEGLEIGDIIPDIDLPDTKGNVISLSSLRGSLVLVDFWASWCVPCRKGNPHLLKLYAEYKPKGLEILGVSDDDKAEDKWKKAVEKDGIGVWKHILRGLQYKEGTYERINIDQDVSEGYNIHSLPTKILVDPNGIIVARNLHGEELQTTLKSLLGNKI